MKYLRAALASLFLIAAGAWSARLLTAGGDRGVEAFALGFVLVAAFAAYMAADRTDEAVWTRFAVYGAAMTVCAAMCWLEWVRPFDAARSLGAFAARFEGRDAVGVFLAAAPPAGFLLTVMLWAELIAGTAKRIGGGGRRRRAASDLYGKARLLERRFLKRLANARGILLGQDGARPSASLIAWPLEGSAITIAPPRTGKGATIALNLLTPGRRGFDGSTVTVDPRGEMWCVAARRRRELGRKTVLLDPFGMVAGHAAQWPEAHISQFGSAFYNPMDFIREEDGHAVRDINVLLDALLTPPPAHASQNSRHFYESARAIVGGYMAWVRFKAPPERRTLARVHALLSLPPTEREEFANMVLRTGRFAGGLAHLAIERQAQVGKEESGSTFTTIANQLAFLTFPELVEHTRTSSFDPIDLADGNTDLFVVAPEETIEHVKGWIRL